MKKVLLMTLALALTFSMSFNASADIYIGSESSEESNLNLLEEFDLSQYPEIAEKMKKQEKALTAYREICANFDKDENGCYIYPESYAGEYIDENGNLIVLYTQMSDDLNFLKSIDGITFKQVEHSLNELAESLNTAKENIADVSGYKFSGSKIDVRSNTATIEISPTSVTSTMRSLLATNIACENVTIEITNTKFGTDSYSIPGGSGIGRQYASSWLSVAANGSWSGNDALLTCGHSTSVGTPVYYNGSVIGSVVKTQFIHNGYGDYAIIMESNNSLLATCRVKTSISATAEIRNAVSYYDDVPVGTTCYKYGNATKQLTELVITETSREVDYNGVTIKGLTGGQIVSGSASDGDSGCPYFLINSDGTVSFAGVHSGSDGSNYVVFTPYHFVAAGFNLTTANEV